MSEPEKFVVAVAFEVLEAEGAEGTAVASED